MSATRPHSREAASGRYPTGDVRSLPLSVLQASRAATKRYPATTPPGKCVSPASARTEQAETRARKALQNSNGSRFQHSSAVTGYRITSPRN